MKLRVAIVGATGAVGREMLEDLADSNINDLDVGLFASNRSAGEKRMFRGRNLEVKAFSEDALQSFDFCLMSAGGEFSKIHAKSIVSKGVTVIDNSSAWRMDPEIPLVVPEVNGSVLKKTRLPTIIANPNCSTIQMVVALKPLHENFGIEFVHVATYQSVSGTGQKGIRELSEQLDQHFKFHDPTPKVYAQPIAFNILPAIDKIYDTGHCFEEIKMIQETRKIMNLPKLNILATTVRVPTFHCHCEAVAVKLVKEVSRNDVIAALRAGYGIVLNDADDHSDFPTPRTVAGEKAVHVARVRLPHETTREHWVQFWIVADNLKKGAATNAVQILENLQSH